MEDNKNIFQIPTTDFSFKRIFGTDANKHFLIHFLNCFVAKYTGPIKDITYLNTEQYGLAEHERKLVFDILCKTDKGRQLIVEMQCARQPDYAERSIFYLSRAISSSQKKSVRTYRITPTYSVNLLDFTLPEIFDSGECFSAFFIKDQKNRILSEKVAFFYMNLCNFATQQSEVTEEMRTWLNLLKNMPHMDESDYSSYTGVFQTLLDECRISKLSKMEKENYEKSVLEYEEVQTAIEYAKELAAKDSYKAGVKKGKEEGREKGREEGLNEGMQKGIEKGKEETLRQMVAGMLKKGIDISTIAEISGMNEEQIVAMQH